MNDLTESERRKTPRPTEPSIAGQIGGPQWNNQAVIDEQLQVIARNERIIARGWLVIIVEVVAAVVLGLAIYVMAK
jgi:hypothetical protein